MTKAKSQFACDPRVIRALRARQNYKLAVSFSCQSQQDSRCCINFPHELSCQILTNQSNFSRLRSVLNQNFNCAAHKHNIFHINLKKIKLEPAIIWKLLTCQRITSKKYLTSMGLHLRPRYSQVILVSGYSVSTAVNWSQHWCPICVHRSPGYGLLVCIISFPVLTN